MAPATLQAIFSSSLIILTFVLADAHPNHHAGKPVHHGGKPITTTGGNGFQPGPWKDAHATFYGEADGSGTFGAQISLLIFITF